MASVRITTRRKERPSRSRIEKADDTRRALFSATATVVGKYGYADASVIRITSEAGVANGTFYNYFETRQHLFDQLLPARGEEILNFIREQVGKSPAGIERERRRITAYFEFCVQNPGFLRILNEAEIFAPRAFKNHMKRFAAGYTRALKRSLQRGEIAGYDERELEAVVHMLMGARTSDSAMGPTPRPSLSAPRSYRHLPQAVGSPAIRIPPERRERKRAPLKIALLSKVISEI